MKPEQIKIDQQYWEPIFVGPSEKDVIQLWQEFDKIQIERKNIQQLIDILTAEL